MASVKKLCTCPVRDLLTELRGCLPIPKRLYVRSSYAWTDKMKVLIALPNIIPHLHFAELHRRDQSLLSASEEFAWDTYVKIVIVPGPGGDLVGQAVYRPIVARDVPEQGKRSREADQCLLAQRLEEVRTSLGEELTEARTKLHATIRLGLGEYETLAARRFKNTMRSRARAGYWDGRGGRNERERRRPSRLRAVVTYDSSAVAAPAAEDDDAPLPSENILVRCATW